MLLEIIEQEKEIAERLDEVANHLIIIRNNRTYLVFPVGDREVVRFTIERAIKKGFDVLVAVFEAKMKSLSPEEMKTYKYGDVLKDEKAKDCVVIWGIEKESNYRVYVIYEREGRKLKEVKRLENEDFDRVRGYLTFMG